MSELAGVERRFILRSTGIGAAGLAASGIGLVDPRPAPVRASPRAVSSSSPAWPPIRQVKAGELNVGYAELGPVAGPVVILLHGWPYDIHSYGEVAPLLAAAGYRVIVPHLRGHGTTLFASPDAMRNGQQAVLALDVIALMDALQIRDAILGGYDWGARSACIVAALWPGRCKALISVSGYLIGSRETSQVPLLPTAEHQWWYQYYFATERGRAGYDMYRREFARLIWELASPKWNFGDAVFDRTAGSLDNPDHVAIVIHNYCWRLGLAAGDSRLDALEERLAKGPTIAVPTITLEGDANGAPHVADPKAYRQKFSGPYAHRDVTGGTGHNLPQEAPIVFVRAVIDAATLS